MIRAADDGVAFRYDLPASLGESCEVVQEPTTFTLPAEPDAWLQPYGPQYENAHVTTTAAAAQSRSYGFPATFRSGEDYAVLTESDVTGTYAGTHLTKVAGAPTYGLELYQDVPVEASGALLTPWRVAILGDAATVVESTLVDDLATPSLVEDTSWISPGVSAWSWVPGASRPDLGSQIGAQGNLEFQKSFADLAARNGWPYILIDEGWQAEWVPELVRYAEARGVGVLAWFHSNRLWTQEQRDSWFDRLEEWGVKGIKVDFMDSDDQATFQWYDDILAETAERQMMINFHGSTIPHGVQRTWPNAVTFEAVRGEEQGKDSRWASHNTVLPFTRNIVGSMDYTPVRFSGDRPASKAHEVALPVVFESGRPRTIPAVPSMPWRACTACSRPISTRRRRRRRRRRTCATTASHVPTIGLHQFLDDSLRPVACDGAGLVEVATWVQHVVAMLMRPAVGEDAQALRELSTDAEERAVAALTSPRDVARVREAAAQARAAR